jgi:hypothetical protein
MNAALVRSPSSSSHIADEAKHQPRHALLTADEQGLRHMAVALRTFQECLAERFRPSKNRRNEDKTGSNRSNRQGQAMFMQRYAPRHSVRRASRRSRDNLIAVFDPPAHAVRRVEHSQSKSPTRPHPRGFTARACACPLRSPPIPVPASPAYRRGESGRPCIRHRRSRS